MDSQLNPDAIADVVAEMQRDGLANAARRAPIGMGDYLDSLDLEKLTGTKASTWRYWASIGKGPASWKLGRRRVWTKSVALAWLAEQEAATGRGGVA